MKKAKVVSKILFSILLVAVLSGCWNYREIEEFAIVSGIAIDRNFNNNSFMVSTEIIEMKSGGKDTKVSTKLLKSEGKTIFDAIRNTIKFSGQKLYFSHAKVLIISKEIAEEGVVPVLNWVNRDGEPRYDIDLLISEEKTARSILEQQNISSDILSFGLEEMLDSGKSLSKAPHLELWQFTKDVSGEGISAILPLAGITVDGGKAVPKIEGTGVFKKDKLVGTLDGDDTEILLFIKNKINGGLLIVDSLTDVTNTNVALEILQNETKLQPVYTDGKLKMKVNIKTQVAIGENLGIEDLNKNESIKKFKDSVENELEYKVKTLVKRVQNEFGSDIFGFGNSIRISIPDLWRKIESQWDQVFREISVEVKADVEIINSAFEAKPIKVGD